MIINTVNVATNRLLLASGGTLLEGIELGPNNGKLGEGLLVTKNGDGKSEGSTLGLIPTDEGLMDGESLGNVLEELGSGDNSSFGSVDCPPDGAMDKDVSALVSLLIQEGPMSPPMSLIVNGRLVRWLEETSSAPTSFPVVRRVCPSISDTTSGYKPTAPRMQLLFSGSGRYKSFSRLIRIGSVSLIPNGVGEIPSGTFLPYMKFPSYNMLMGGSSSIIMEDAPEDKKETTALLAMVESFTCTGFLDEDSQPIRIASTQP